MFRFRKVCFAVLSAAVCVFASFVPADAAVSRSNSGDGLGVAPLASGSLGMMQATADYASTRSGSGYGFGIQIDKEGISGNASGTIRGRSWYKVGASGSESLVHDVSQAYDGVTEGRFALPYAFRPHTPSVTFGNPSASLTGAVTGATVFTVTGECNSASVDLYYRSKGEFTPGSGSGMGSLSTSSSWSDLPGGWGKTVYYDALKSAALQVNASAAWAGGSSTDLTASFLPASVASTCEILTTAVSMSGAGDQYSNLNLGVVRSGKRTYALGVEHAGKYAVVQWVSDTGKQAVASVKVPDAYCISYDAQGGSGAPSVSGKVFGGYGVPVSGQAPARQGYDFLGWYTAPNGGGTAVAAGSSLKLSSNVILYAAWKAKWKVTTSKEGEGYITPDITAIGDGEDRSVEVRPSDGWFIDSILLDGTALPLAGVDPGQPYTVPVRNIRGDHSVHVRFYKGLSVTTSASGGTVSGTVSKLRRGSDVEVTFGPDAGKYVKSIIVDGEPLTRDALADAVKSGKFLFRDVRADHTIHIGCADVPKLEVRKLLEGERSLVAGEAVFGFRVSGEDYLGDAYVFYLQLTVPEGEDSASGSLTLPAGDWEVSELMPDGWGPVGEGVAETSTLEGGASVEFTNQVSDFGRYVHRDGSTNRLASD